MEKGNKLPLIALIAYGSDCDSKDPKDIIYSVLDLAKSRHDRGLVQPDYRKEHTAGQLYTDIVMNFIKKHQSLDIICFAHVFNQKEISRNIIENCLAGYQIGLQTFLRTYSQSW